MSVTFLTNHDKDELEAKIAEGGSFENPTDEEILQALIDTYFLLAVTDSDGAILTDADGAILVM